MTKLNVGPNGSAFSFPTSLRTRERTKSNRHIQLLEICVSSWKQGSSSNSNRNKNALFAILPVSILLALCGMLASCANTMSSSATTPVITAQPANATVTVGQPATFTVAAAGTAPLSYQWTKNGMNVGTNSATYPTAATTSSDNNAKIQVTVSNSKGSAPSSTVTLTVDAASTKPSITTQPASVTVTVGQTATFTVAATGAAPLTYQWTKNGTNVGTNSATYTTAATTSADNGAQIKVTVSNSAGSTPSSMVTLTVTGSPPTPSSANALTYHNDVGRTGQNLNETILTHSNVNSTNFGKKAFLTTDGLVDAEPLYVSNLQIGGAAHNVVFVVTEHNSVYAFDADTFTQLWKVSRTPSGGFSGEGGRGR